MRGVSGKEWVVLSHHIKPDEETVKRYGRFLSQLIANRGYEKEGDLIFDLKLRNLLPYRFLPNVEEGIERIERAVVRGERIVIFGDYDVDGITGTAILYDVLKRAGARVVPVLPTRETGYGLNVDLMNLFSKYCDLLITVDNGTSSIDEIDGSPVDVVVIDHHNVPEKVPERCVLINPRISDETPEHMKNLSSSAVCFYMASALARRLGLDMDVREHLDLVAIGTVGDVMPMNYINRILVHKGIKVLESVAKGVIRKPGVEALLKVAKLNGRISSRDLAYSLAPRINAPGRIADPRLSLKLLLEKDPLRADVLARKVEVINLKRRSITEAVYRSAYRKAVRQEGVSFVSLWDRGWHVGVIGIVAGRIAEALGRPVAVFSVKDKHSVGSVRSVDGVDVYEGLKRISHMFIKWGGHPQAAGITLESSKLEDFSRSAEEVFSGLRKKPRPLYIDMELSPKGFTEHMLKDIRSLEPYGEKNPFPTFLSEDLKVVKVEYRQGRLLINAEGVRMVCWEKKIFPYIYKGMRKRMVYSVVDGEFHLIDVEA